MQGVEIIKIDSLSAFMEQLEYIPAHAFFRGENAFFEKRSASAFRTEITENGDVMYDYKNMLKTFYSEISYKLNSTEEVSFLAFAQYYGIPTNLIDR